MRGQQWVVVADDGQLSQWVGTEGQHHEGIVNAWAMRGIRPWADYFRWWSQVDNDLEVVDETD